MNTFQTVFYTLARRVEDEAKRLLKEKYDCMSISFMKRGHFDSWSVTVHRLDGQPPIKFIGSFDNPVNVMNTMIEALIQAQEDQAKGIADIKQTLEPSI